MAAYTSCPVSVPVPDPTPSYWQNPPSTLANRQDNEALRDPSQPYDYAIVGSGITGTLIAYNILQRDPGARIVMLEARTACSGATGRNGGHTKAASYRSYLEHKRRYGKEEALTIARLEHENIRTMHRLAEELGIKEDCESHMCDTVDLIYDEATFEQGERAVAELRADADPHEREAGGMADYRLFNAQDAVKNFYAGASMRNENPCVRHVERLAGAFAYPAGRIHAYRFTTSILGQCIEKGLQLCTNTPVQRITEAGNTDQTSVSGHSTQMYTLHTPSSTIRAHKVFLATNGYTPFLLPQLHRSIVPLRGQVAAQAVPADAALPPLLPTTYSFIYSNGYEYMIPRPLPPPSSPYHIAYRTRGEAQDTQHIVIGGGLGRVPLGSEHGTTDDSTVNGEIGMYLECTVFGYFGSEKGGSRTRSDVRGDTDYRCLPVAEWTGIMGTTPDGLPLVGEVPGKKGLWIAAGFNGHGMVLCAKTAEAVVRIMFAAAKGWADGGKSAAEMGRGDEERGKKCLEWFPRSFLVTEERLKVARENPEWFRTRLPS